MGMAYPNISSDEPTKLTDRTVSSIKQEVVWWILYARHEGH